MVRQRQRQRKETTEQREQRLLRQRERNRVRLANETESQRQRRLERARIYQQRRRANTSESQQAIRLENNRIYQQQYRENETSFQQQRRLIQQQNYRVNQRQIETVEENMQQLQLQNQRTQEQRQSEIGEQQTQYLMGNSVQQINWQQNQQSQNRLVPQIQLVRTHFNARNGIVPKPHNIGTFTIVCEYCSGMKFDSETTNICCAGGAIAIPLIPTPPPLLASLFTGQHPKSVYFMKSLRVINTSMSFAALVCNQDTLPGTGPPIFRVQGGVYHTASTVFPRDPQQAGFAQLFILDSTAATSIRNQRFHIDEALLLELHEMLCSVNPFVNIWQNMHSMCQEYEARRGGEQRSITLRLAVRENEQEGHQGQYNLPTATEVAVVFDDNASGSTINRDVVVFSRFRPNTSQRIPSISPLLDPLLYPVFFPLGTYGWFPELHSIGNVEQRVTLAKYVIFQIATRQSDFNMIIRGRMLFQVYIVDVWTRLEAHRLDYIRNHQKELRADQYKGLMDYLANRNETETFAGRVSILPSSFIGSPRYLQQRLQDAISLIVQFGFPDLFITFTCNTNWEEIRGALLPGQLPIDRPDIVSRVFNVKRKALLAEIEKGQIFGRVLVVSDVVEFQKRGLPHAHILVILHPNDKVGQVADEVDSIVSAELPSQVDDPNLFDLVRTHMIHGPCGENFLNAVCMEERGGQKRCKKYFPREFQERTMIRQGQYPCYRRRDLGRRVEVRGAILDSRNVVPYNPYLLRRFKAHINVEICSSFTCVKYLYKYVYKGSDRTQIQVINNQYNNSETYDEVSKYLDLRYVSAHEAIWRIYGFDITHSNYAVQLMQLHLPNQQQVQFRQGEEEAAIGRMRNTMLQAYFQLNQELPEARAFRYNEIVEYYTWVPTQRIWKKRERNCKIIGRLPFVPPRFLELFYLRLLLSNRCGPLSFEDLRTIDGVTHTTFRAAAQQLGLLEEDNEWELAISEAIEFQMPSQLRELFACILVYNNPNDPVHLWNQYLPFFCEDIQNSNNPEAVALGLVAQRVSFLGHSITEFGFELPEVFPFELENYNSNSTANIVPEVESNPNEEQQLIIRQIETAVEQEAGGLFFMNGPGGTGKTFVYKVLISKLQQQGFKVVVVASTGIAATLLPGGSTAHTRFKLPLSITENSVSSITSQSAEARQLREASLIIWDEAVMQHRYVFETVDRLLQDLTQCQVAFGGKVLLLGGDFRQILPVVRRGNRGSTIAATIKSSYLWERFQVLHLTRNMRVEVSEVNFSQFLLEVGEGSGNIQGTDDFIIPAGIILQPNQDIIAEVFRDLADSPEAISKYAILCARNTGMVQMNEEVLRRLPGEAVQYFSIDHAIENEITGLEAFPPEFLNTLSFSGLPPHQLNLKIGAIVMLLCNLNVANGLCNGTRLRVVELQPHIIAAVPLNGTMMNQVVFIPRIELQPSDTDMEVSFTRRQFPIQLSFAMTINKSQGQTFERVGIVLQEPVFSHGQLYVAFSRCKTSTGLKVKLPQGVQQTKNIVYREIL